MFLRYWLPLLSQKGGKAEKRKKKGGRRKGWNHAKYMIFFFFDFRNPTEFVFFPPPRTLSPPPLPPRIRPNRSLLFPSRRPWLPCVREKPNGQAPSTGRGCAFGHSLEGFEDQKDARFLPRRCWVTGRPSGGREREGEGEEEHERAVATHSYQRDRRTREATTPSHASSNTEGKSLR